MKSISKYVIITIVCGIIGGYIGGNQALKEFRKNHSTLTVYESDAQFLREDLERKLGIIE